MKTLEEIKDYYLSRARDLSDFKVTARENLETAQTIADAINRDEDLHAVIGRLNRSVAEKYGENRELREYITLNRDKNKHLMEELDSIAPFKWQYVPDNKDGYLQRRDGFRPRHPDGSWNCCPDFGAIERRVYEDTCRCSKKPSLWDRFLDLIYGIP